MSSEIDDFMARTGLYAQYSGIIVKRVADRMVSGFQSLLTIDEKTHYAFFRDRAITMAKRGLYHRAVDFLEQSHESKPTDTEVLIYLGLSYIKTDKKEKGVELLELAHKTDKTDIRPITILGIAYVLDEEYKKAIPLLVKAVKESPENFNLQYRLGMAYDKVEDHVKAIKAFSKALELKPDEAKAHRSIGF